MCATNKRDARTTARRLLTAETGLDGSNPTVAFPPTDTRLTPTGTGDHAMATTHHQYSPIETDRLRDWIARWIGANWIWHAKFLSGTETSATQALRPGPRVPRELLKPAFPSLAENVRTAVEFETAIDSHGVREDRVRGVPHIGEGHLGRPQAQIRITNLGASSPLLDPENTGALTIFVFRPGPSTDSPKCRVWICRNLVETDVADDLIGPVEPGIPVPWGY